MRRAANDLDKPESPYKAVVSVLVLKEGWDIKNVSTIVGLRPYSSPDGVLSEQTLGRGLRRISPENFIDCKEVLSVIGTDNFITFLEEVNKQGVMFGTKPMGSSLGYMPSITLIKPLSNRADLDIEVPLIGAKYLVDHGKISDIDESKLIKEKIKAQKFAENELQTFTFEYAFPEDEEKKDHHTLTIIKGSYINISNIVKWYVKIICQNTKTLTMQDLVYEKVYLFIKKHLFENPLNSLDHNVAQNLNETKIKELIIDTFSNAINTAIIVQRNSHEPVILDWLAVSEFTAMYSKKSSIKCKKSIFDSMVGDSGLEQNLSLVLDKCKDIISHAKIYRHWKFSLDYQKADDSIANYIPDFLVKQDDKNIYVIESKGAEYAVDSDKFSRLQEWCKLANVAQNRYNYDCLYITQDKFDMHKNTLKSFSDLKAIATDK
ncbi:MAG: hypothetical protein HAW67_00830 [Endozoicomonadaceae bacterium]|nr:hypothetical protein [Endozoicomonadaceae bacterium]